ncbi:13455_t:CDS:1, partial [Ambispora gerdemannii]
MDTPKIWWSSFKNQPRYLAELAHRIFSINPTQANCERNFSTLKWMGERRTSLGLNKLEGMAKIRSYYMTNIQHELSFFGKELTEADLQDACNVASIGNIMNYEEDQIRVSEESLLDNIILDYPTTLLIEEIIDLTAEENLEFSIEIVQVISSADLDYDPHDILN